MHTLRYHVDQPTISIIYEGRDGREEVRVTDPSWSLTLEVPEGFFAYLRAQKGHDNHAVIECVIILNDWLWQAAHSAEPFAAVECFGIVHVPD